MNKIKFKIIIISFLLTFIFLKTIGFAEILSNWEDARAYKPNPVLFMHGFALGDPSEWGYILDGKHEGMDNYEGISKYFKSYANVNTSSDYTKFNRSYLARMDFMDPNGSIDTYGQGIFNPQGDSKGWADKISVAMNNLVESYRFKGEYLKFNFVCFSMGGLAAREYLTNPKYSNSKINIDKMITIGTPHAGTPIASVREVFESSLSNGHKYVWEVPYYGRAKEIFEWSADSKIVSLLRGKQKIEFDGEAIKDLAIKSNFLNLLNHRVFPSNIKKCAIFSEATSTGFRNLNSQFFGSYYENEYYSCGDGIVPRDSQKGYDIMSEFPSRAYWVWQPSRFESINADHPRELDNAATVRHILSFLDSNKPEFTLDSPAEGNTTQINTTSISVKGKVYKEYLPADSKLIINVIKQENNTTQPTQENLLQPSSLWQPNNPDSPVAEFNQTITFPGEGTYKVTTYIKNPAGLESDKKEFWVKVSLTGAANIIVHCHNPEGKEIGSILGQYSVVIFDGENTIGYGASNITDHEKSLTLKNGIHTIKAEFNGIVKEQNINLIAGETKDIIFIFNRTEFNILSKIIEGFNGSVTLIFSRDFNREENKIIYNEIEGKYIKKYNVNFAGTGNFSINYSISFDGINYRASALSSYSLTEEIPYDTFPDLPYINDYSMIEYNGDSDGSNIFFHQANLIPSQSGFSNWYTQSITSGSFYPRFRVLNSGSDSIGVIINGGSDSMLGYSVNSFSANISYDTLSGGGGFGMGPSSFVIIGPGEKSNNFEITGTLSGLKMSSVPYDFTGDAF